MIKKIILLNYSSKICPNMIKWTISYEKTGFQKPVPISDERVNSVNLKKYKKFIVVILESPHILEYFDNCGNIRKTPSPLSGKSKDNFENFFSDCLNSNKNIGADPGDIFAVIILNPVRYQASLGISPINNLVKEINWINLWSKEKNNFLKTLKTIYKDNNKNIILLNFATKGKYICIKQIISEFLTDNKYCFYSERHPASWKNSTKFNLK